MVNSASEKTCCFGLAGSGSEWELKDFGNPNGSQNLGKPRAWRPHAPDLMGPSSSGLAGRSDDGDRRNTLCSPFVKFQLKVQDSLDSRALIE